MPLPTASRFLAIDFETADYGRDSACAIGLVRVEQGEVTARVAHLIRPPRREFVFTYIHGITWADVQSAPTFRELWPAIQPLFQGVDFLAAHNSSFDKGVLHACCRSAGVEAPAVPFQCTVRLARQVWGIHPTRLSDVCRHLSIPLNHHEVSSDVEACAAIVMRALERDGGRSGTLSGKQQEGGTSGRLMRMRKKRGGGG
jgi:DNA polymerase-3 subunit epsilon